VHALFSIVIVFVLCDMALACAALYLLPVLIGCIRRVPDIGSVAVINVLLGWTLVGWAAALAMALRSPRPAPPAVQVVQHFPQPQPWPDERAEVGWAGPPGPPPPRLGTPPPLTLPPRAQASADSTSSREYQ
jgi:Superinfection immunity protein